MTTPIYSIYLNARERVAAYPDMTSYSLEDIIGEDYGAVVLDGPRGARGTYGDTNYMEDAIRGLADNFYRGSSPDWWDRRNRAIHLYLSLCGYHSVIHTLKGYSQGDWMEVVLFVKREADWQTSGYNIVDTVPYANAWFAGDIYSLVHEKLECYENINNPEDTIEQWNEVDSISCQIILDQREFVTVACIEFDIPKVDYLVVTG